jgi:hypothetical protein
MTNDKSSMTNSQSSVTPLVAAPPRCLFATSCLRAFALNVFPIREIREIRGYYAACGFRQIHYDSP